MAKKTVDPIAAAGALVVAEDAKFREKRASVVESLARGEVLPPKRIAELCEDPEDFHRLKADVERLRRMRELATKMEEIPKLEQEYTKAREAWSDRIEELDREIKELQDKRKQCGDIFAWPQRCLEEARRAEAEFLRMLSEEQRQSYGLLEQQLAAAKRKLSEARQAAARASLPESAPAEQMRNLEAKRDGLEASSPGGALGHHRRALLTQDFAELEQQMARLRTMSHEDVIAEAKSALKAAELELEEREIARVSLFEGFLRA